MIDNRKKLKQFSLEAICIGLLMITIYLVFGTFIGLAVVQGDSMLPTLQDGSTILINKAFTKPEVGDIVIVDPDKYDKEVIKRVIAKEGDTVYIDFGTGRVYVNGQQLEETYIKEPTYRNYDVKFPITVEPGCIFVMGDNRNESIDSRSSKIGQIPVEHINGIYITTIKY